MPTKRAEPQGPDFREDDALPEGWVWARLGGGLVDDIQPGFACGEHDIEGASVPHLRPMNVTVEGTVSLSNTKHVPRAYITGDSRLLRKGDVLFNNTNSPELVGKTAYIDFDGELAFSNHMTRLRCSVGTLVPRYCSLALHRKWHEGYFLGACNNHVSQASISRSVLADTEIPLPPLPEQRRIVGQVEALLARVNAARARLARGPALLKAFRQAVLSAACSGKLTEDWRKAETLDDSSGASLVPPPLNEHDLPQLPESWKWARFDSVLTELKNGISTKPEINPPGFPILRISAVRPGKVLIEDFRYLPGSDELVNTYGLRNRDLLFTRYNGSLDLLGVCGMVRGLKRTALLYPDKLMRARVNPKLMVAEFAELFFQEGIARDRMTRASKSSAGQQGVSGKNVKEQPIALPSLPEQQEIVRRVEALFALADTIEAKVTAAQKRADALTQAILAKAFRGELVPTEAALARVEGRCYESAKELLERVLSQKSACPATDSPRQRKRQRKG